MSELIPRASLLGRQEGRWGSAASCFRRRKGELLGHSLVEDKVLFGQRTSPLPCSTQSNQGLTAMLSGHWGEIGPLIAIQVRVKSS